MYCSYSSFIHYSIQTLTELYIFGNDIGPQGAQYLANALQQNNVFLLNIIFIFQTNNYYFI